MTNNTNNEEDHPDISKIVEKVNEHIETRLYHFRLVISEKIALALSRMTSIGIITGLFLLFFFFLNVAIAMWIGKHFNDYSIGFGCIAGFYFLAIIIYMLLRKSVFERKMTDSFIKSMFAEEEEEDEDEE